jgi:hypothetical protein
MFQCKTTNLILNSVLAKLFLGQTALEFDEI